jgi:hypothetical protein
LGKARSEGQDGGQLEEPRREEGGKQLEELRKLRESIEVTAHL